MYSCAGALTYKLHSWHCAYKPSISPHSSLFNLVLLLTNFSFVPYDIEWVDEADYIWHWRLFLCPLHTFRRLQDSQDYQQAFGSSAPGRLTQVPQSTQYSFTYLLTYLLTYYTSLIVSYRAHVHIMSY